MRRLFSALLVWLLCGPAAALTPQEVWADWQLAVAHLGGRLTAETAELRHGQLMLHGVTVFFNNRSQGGLYLKGSIWQLLLIQATDGSVTVLLPTVTDFQVSPHLASFDVSLGFGDGQLRIEDRGGSRVYALQGYAATLDYSGWAGTFDAKRSGKIRMKEPRWQLDFGAFSYDVAADQLTYDVQSKTPQNGEAAQNTGSYKDFTSQAELGLSDVPTRFWSMPRSPQSLNLALHQQFGAGMVTRFAFAADTAEMRRARTVRGQTFASWRQDQAPRLRLKLDKTGIRFDASDNSGVIAIYTPDQDLQFAFGPLSFGVTWPLLVADFDPVRFDVHLQDLSLPPDWWALHDPDGIFPHDRVQLDVSGGALLRSDTLGQMIGYSVGQLVPGPQPAARDVVVERLHWFGLGAMLEASGSLARVPTPKGSAPRGQGQMRVTGAMDLVEGLQSSGMLNADGALRARWMLNSMFRPSDDLSQELSSKLEMRADGSVWVNGIKLR